MKYQRSIRKRAAAGFTLLEMVIVLGIIAVLLGDPVYGEIRDLPDVPGALVDRLVHYFSTYKLPRTGKYQISVGEPYGRSHAEAVVLAALSDYRRKFPAEEDAE